MKFRKKEIANYNQKIEYIRKELKTGRHIVACLGSAGLIFVDEIERFCSYAFQIGALDISEEIIKH